MNNVKDELIKRGEKFQLDIEFEKEIKQWTNEELRNLVENECDNYHLEFLEIARKEFLKRGLKNEKLEEDEEDEIYEIVKKYPALRNQAKGYYILACIVGIITIPFAIYYFNISILFGISTIILGLGTAFGLAAISESIIVIIDIEENTRRKKIINTNK